MDTCFKELYDYALVEKCNKCGIVKLKTVVFRNINQKFRKDCVQSTNIKQNLYNSKNREKIKITKNEIDPK